MRETETPYRHSVTGRVVLRSLVRVVCPPEAHDLADAIVDHMALTLGASPALLQRGFAAGLLAYDLGAIPLHFRRARSLSATKADAYFASWEHGPTPLHVQFARAIKQLMSLSCYEQPAMLDRLGYQPGPWIETVRAKRLKVFANEIRRQDVQILAPDPLRPGVVVARKVRA